MVISIRRGFVFEQRMERIVVVGVRMILQEIESSVVTKVRHPDGRRIVEFFWQGIFAASEMSW